MSKKLGLRLGVSLIEVLVAAFIFTIVGVAVFQSYTSIVQATRMARARQNAIALANEQIEIIRNMPYASVGLTSGLPAGVVPRFQTLSRNGLTYYVTTTIRTIDDTFDGTINGTPKDLSPNDYKLVEILVDAPYENNFTPVVITTNVMPKNLETAQNNGALFINVFNANGQPVAQADVHIENKQTTTTLIINEQTNNDGQLQIVDAPPGVQAYEISVSKTGYSSDRTYTPGDTANPNPTLPHATVALQQVTSISFSIDQTSNLIMSSLSDLCSPIGSIGFNIRGSKTIGTSPTVYKYSQTKQTGVDGNLNLTGLEWDSYLITLNDASYDLIGTIPSALISLTPNASQDLKLIVAGHNPSTLLANIKDSATKLPLSGAEITLSKTGFSQTKQTGRGFLRQTNWSGGSGQTGTMDDLTKFNQSANVEFSGTAGQLTLVKNGSNYESSGWLESSLFDAISPSNLQQIYWEPISQSQHIGSEAIRFQIASGTSTSSTFNFLGPDGTESSYYSSANTNISSSHNGHRYFKYKVFLQTASSTYTPLISDVAFTFTSDCIPPGQTAFQGLDTGTYDISISKTGYQTYTDIINITEDWQEAQISMQPE